tara:strand:- start:15649 stop:15897 length:249 start_codon:yes stop_codon:yes gene_type:complete
MKRERFLITSTKGHNVIKYSWNAARKEVQRLMQEYANENGGQWMLTSKAEKQGFYFVSGVMIYTDTQAGKEVTFSIKKQEDI